MIALTSHRKMILSQSWRRECSAAIRSEAYDAAYVELAVREGVPLATLDSRMQAAAIKAVVEVFDLARGEL